MNERVPVVRFGRTGVEVSRVALGTWAFGGANQSATGRDVGWSGHDDEAALAAMRRAYERGIRHWDTADVYGDGRAEALIGRAFKEGRVPRDDVFLASKVGWDKGGYAEWYDPRMMRRALDGSLARLGVERIDLYYLHHCMFGPGDRALEPALAVLHEARAAGKIRWLGLSDYFDEAIMRVVATVDPDVVQPLRNATRDTFQASGLAGWCRHHDVGVAFFSPIRQGLLLGKYREPPTFSAGDVRNNDRGFRDAHVVHRLAENAAALRERFGARSAEPVLAALLATDLADCDTGVVLLGQRNPAQVDAAAHAADLALSDEELAWVRSLYAGIPSD